MELTIESLGLTKDEIAERVVDRMVEELVTGKYSDTDEDGNPIMSEKPSPFGAEIKQRVRDRIDQAIDQIAAKNVLPNVATYLESLTMQETNRWGEKTKSSVTFIEYLVSRAENYLTEQVDFDGKTKEQCYSSSFRGTQTRITHMVHQHLHYSIETAMKQAMKDINASVAKGLNDAVRIKLEEVVSKISTSVKIA